METATKNKEEMEKDDERCQESQTISSSEATSSMEVTDSNNTQTTEGSAYGRLSSLYEVLREPIPENPTAKYIGDAAHKLVECLNAKRKNDTQLIEQFKMALEAQTEKCIHALEDQLYRIYETHNSQVDRKLQDLFACLDNISAAETELENFRDSLKKLYQEMHSQD